MINVCQEVDEESSFILHPKRSLIFDFQ